MFTTITKGGKLYWLVVYNPVQSFGKFSKVIISTFKKLIADYSSVLRNNSLAGFSV